MDPIISTETAQDERASGRAWSLLASAIFLLCLFAQGAYCYLRPAALFDTMAYVAIANGKVGNGFENAGKTCSAELPGIHSGCGDVIELENYKKVAAYSSTDFSIFLRFYEVKPLYTSSVALIRHLFGVSAYVALRLVSSGSFILIGLVMWFWLREHLSTVAASTVALFVANSPSVLDLGKRLLPDGFCTCLLLLAAYLILYKKPVWLGVAALALLPFSRTDNIIFAVMLGLALISISKYPIPRKATLAALVVLAAIVIQFTLQKTLHSLSYFVLFRHSFVTWTDPASFPGTKVSLHEYLVALAVYGSRTIILDLPEGLLFATLALADRTSSSALRALVWASLATVAIRLLLFPGMEVRYYVWFYLVSAIAATSVLGQALSAKRGWFVADA